MPHIRTCAHCQRVIGVYEPMVVVLEGEARQTSPLNEPVEILGDCLHAECFEEAQEND